MTRKERDQLISIKLDIGRALWLLNRLIQKAGEEHAVEDRHNSSQETAGGANGRPTTKSV